MTTKSALLAFLACSLIAASVFTCGGTPAPQVYLTPATSGTGTAVPSLNITIPANGLPGDEAILFVADQLATGAHGVATPGGWTACTNNPGTNTSGNNFYVFYKFLASADPGATLTISTSSSNDHLTLGMYVLRSATVPDNVSCNYKANSATASFTTNSVTPQAANELAIAGFMQPNNSVFTPQSGWTQDLAGTRQVNLETQHMNALTTSSAVQGTLGLGAGATGIGVLLFVPGELAGPSIIAEIGVGGNPVGATSLPTVTPTPTPSPTPTPTADADQIATLEYASGHTGGSVSGNPPTSSMAYMSWVEMPAGYNSTAAAQYNTQGVLTYQYTDAGYCVSSGDGPTQVSYCSALGAAPPPTNNNYYIACSNGGYLQPFASVQPLVNPLFAFNGSSAPFEAVWQAYNTTNSIHTDAWYIDSLFTIGLKDSTSSPADPCYNGHDYTYNGATYNTLTGLVGPGLADIPNHLTQLFCDCWGGGNSGAPYRSGSFWGIPASYTGSVVPQSVLESFTAGGRAEGAFISLNGYNTLALWQGTENSIIVAGNSSLYSFLKVLYYHFPEDPASTQGRSDRLWVIASIDLVDNCGVIGHGICQGYTVYQPVFHDPTPCFYSDMTNCTTTLPEDTFRGLNPYVAMPANTISGCSSNCNGIQTFKSATGNYFREYKDGFLADTRIGRCLVVSNPNAATENFPTPATDPAITENYLTVTGIQTMVLTGATIDGGGTATFTGGHPATTIAAHNAVIACDPNN